MSQWTPQTRDDFRAHELYDDATITGLATTLRFAPGMDRDSLAERIRPWASKWIAILRGTRPDTSKDERDKLEDVAAKLREAATALDELPDTAKARMASLRPGGDSAWPRNLGYVMSASRKVMELAALTEKTAKGVKVDRGRPPRDDKLQSAVRDLCLVYHGLTGRLPGRVYDGYNCRPIGQFQAFVAAAIQPLWPTAGSLEGQMRTAISWYKKNRPRA